MYPRRLAVSYHHFSVHLGAVAGSPKRRADLVARSKCVPGGSRNMARVAGSANSTSYRLPAIGCSRPREYALHIVAARSLEPEEVKRKSEPQ
jgi:hypothetical protein